MNHYGFENSQLGPRLGDIPAHLYNQITHNTTIAVVDVLIVDSDGKYILGKRKNEPLKGVLWMPGGRIIKGESFLLCLKRILMYEVGISTPNDVIDGPIVQLKSYIFSHPYDSDPALSKDVLSTVFLVNLRAGAVLDLSDQHDGFSAHKPSDIGDLHPDLEKVIGDHQHYLKNGNVPNELVLG